MYYSTTNVCIYVCRYMPVYCTEVLQHQCMYVCMYVYMPVVCTDVSIYQCTYVCRYVCVYVILSQTELRNTPSVLQITEEKAKY